MSMACVPSTLPPDQMPFRVLLKQTDYPFQSSEECLRMITEIDPQRDLTTAIEFCNSYPVVTGINADLYQAELRGEMVAAKAIRYIGSTSNTSEMEQQKIRVLREITIWWDLRHPNILPFYGFVTWLNRPLFLISPWLEEGCASEYLQRQPMADRLLMLAEIGDGLGYLHDRGLVHGDLKGRNVLVRMVGSHPQPLLCDFGLSKALHVTGFTTAVRGTVAFMARELLMPGSDEAEEASCTLTSSSDVWAWGMTAYELLSGARPFNHIHCDIRLTRHIAAGHLPERPGPLAYLRGLNDSMWALMQRSWNFDPSERPTAYRLSCETRVIRARLQRSS